MLIKGDILNLYLPKQKDRGVLIKTVTNKIGESFNLYRTLYADCSFLSFYMEPCEKPHAYGSSQPRIECCINKVKNSDYYIHIQETQSIYRNRGNGSLLERELICFFKEYQYFMYIDGEVKPNDPSSPSELEYTIRFWEKMGFKHLNGTIIYELREDDQDTYIRI